MKATEQYFPVVLFIILCKVVLLLSLWVKNLSVSIKMKATEWYVSVLRFTVLYKVVPVFDHSNRGRDTEQYLPVVS